MDEQDKGDALSHGFRKFEAEYFLRDKIGTVGQRVGWDYAGGWAGWYSEYPKILPILIQTRMVVAQ